MGREGPGPARLSGGALGALGRHEVPLKPRQRFCSQWALGRAGWASSLPDPLRPLGSSLRSRTAGQVPSFTAASKVKSSPKGYEPACEHGNGLPLKDGQKSRGSADRTPFLPHLSLTTETCHP